MENLTLATTSQDTYSSLSNVPRGSTRENSVKRCCLFAARVSYINYDKTLAFNRVQHLCSELLISEEEHFNQDDPHHHHWFIRTHKKYTISQIKKLINFAYQDKNNPVFYISSVRQRAKYISYITKYDTFPIYKNISEDLFSFAFKARKWAKKTQRFSYNDPFVIGHPQYYRVLNLLHDEVQNEVKASTKPILSPYDHTKATKINGFKEIWPCDWPNKVIEWINEWILNGFIRKKEQLYLWGASGVGKTGFIDFILEAITGLSPDDLSEYIFTPTQNDFKYAYQSFDKDRHIILKIDEFEINDYNIPDFKKAIAGESLVSNTKGGSARKFSIKMPMIFLSNYPPPSSESSQKYIGIIERLKVINADYVLYPKDSN